MSWELAAWLLLGGSTVLIFLGLPVAFGFLVINLVGAWLYLGGEPGLGRGETVFKVGHGSTLAEVELVLDLDGKGIAGPGLLKGFKGIPLAQFRRF